MSIDLSEFDSDARRECKLKTTEFTPEQREKLDAVVDNQLYSTYAIRKVLQRWGHPLATQTIDKHRKRDDSGKRTCGCDA